MQEWLRNWNLQNEVPGKQESDWLYELKQLRRTIPVVDWDQQDELRKRAAQLEEWLMKWFGRIGRVKK